MKKIVLFLLAVIFTACSPDDHLNPDNNTITLSTQAEVDAFLNNGTTITTKSIVVGTTVANKFSDINNLNGLRNLTSAQDIYIGNNPLLTTLAGLENLTKVNNTFYILNNTALTSLEALHSLKQVRSLAVQQDNALTNLKGLEGLTTVTDLYVGFNKGLTSLQGLTNLTAVESTFEIGENPLLVSLSGLDNFTTANLLYLNGAALNDISALEDVAISNLYLYKTNLTSLAGLEGLTSINSLYIQENAALQSLSGLDNLTSTQLLNITGNSSLKSLSSLASLTLIDGTGFNEYNLQINNNNALTTLNGLQNVLVKNSRIALSGNTQLSNFCALRTMIADSGFNALLFVVRENLFNPSVVDIQGNNCSLN